MGVDYFPCDGCGETICDCGDFARCECEKWFCEKCRDELLVHFPRNNDGGFESCWFCTESLSLRRVDNQEFIEWLIKVSGKTHKHYLDHLVREGGVINDTYVNDEDGYVIVQPK